MEPGRKLAAILVADVAGYSRLMEDDEQATVATLDAYRAVFREQIKAYEGRVVDMAGDSVLAVFETATGAVGAALDIQTALAARNESLSETRRMRFRIGVNLGEVLQKEDGSVYGDGVNIAARLETISEPEGVTVSGTVYDQVKNRLQARFDFIGEQMAKNIAEPIRAYRAAIHSKVKANASVLMLPTGPAIAVLAFDNMSGDSSQEFFSDGITEEIIAGLSRFTNFRVIARNSTFQYKGRSIDVRQIGRELGAEYVVEGSVRRAAQTVRVTAQLLDASNGAHLWAESYDRRLDLDNLFAVQDDITSQVVTRIGDIHGAVNRAHMQRVRAKGTASLADYECVLLAYEYQRFLTPDKHAAVKHCLTHTVERSPDYGEAWAILSYTYADQYWAGYEGPPDPLERALHAARRAVELDPTSPIAHFVLANVHFFMNDLGAFFVEAEKALELNPNNTEILGALGVRYTSAERHDRGLALMEKAKALNPSHPTWYWSPLFYAHYQNRDYQGALEALRRVDTPQVWWWHAQLAMCYGQLGRRERAKAELDEALKLNPAIKDDPHRFLRMWLKSAKALQNAIDGLRKAGLTIPDKKR